MSKRTTKAGGRKQAVFDKIVNLARKYTIIGVVDMICLPTPQLQRMREQLRDRVEIFMANKRVMQKAINNLKGLPKIQELNQYLEKSQPALLFTQENPFSLFKTLKQNKSKAPAKGGQIAPNDIIVPAGQTSFAPGPIIGELGALGIKAGVEGGKITIKTDTKVCSAGSSINEKLASMLTRLGIEPMEIGLDLKVAYEKGILYPKKILNIDEKQFLNDVIKAATESYNLAIETAYCTKDTTEELIKKAFLEAKTLIKEASIMCDLAAEELVEHAEKEMLALKIQANINIPEKQETQKQEEPKKETKQEEQKPETKKPHPKQGHITQTQATELLKKLQKEGTLRKQ